MSLDVRGALEERGCLYLDQGVQFVGVSGKHLMGYCNIDPALTDVAFMSDVAEMLVEPYLDDGVETILSPATGAIPIGHIAALKLIEKTGDPSVSAAWADKTDDPKGFVIERDGFAEVIGGRKVLIVEDMVNQMFSAGELVRITRELEGEVVGVGSIAANRGVTADKLSVPRFDALCEFAYDVFSEEACIKDGPCSQGMPIVDNIGHGSEYMLENPNYPGGYVTL